MPLDAATAFQGSIRGKEVTVANITSINWHQAIQTINTMLSHVSMMYVNNTQNILTKDYPVSMKRTDPQWGITEGTLSGISFERISFQLENFYHMAGQDITDRVDKPFNIQRRLASLVLQAEDRLISQMCIKAMIHPILSTADGVVDTNSRHIEARVNQTRKKRMNVWYAKDLVAGGLASTYKVAYHPLTFYEHLNHQFRRREVNTPLCILATTRLMKELEKWKGETNFPYGLRSAQVISPFELNTYNNRGGLSSFMWEGYRHVRIFESNLPTAKMFEDEDTTATPYISTAVVTSRNADMTIPMKDLSQEDVHIQTVLLNMNDANTAAKCNAASTTTYMDAVATTTSVPAGTYADVKTNINDLTFVWSPMHLRFVSCPMLYMRNKSDMVIRLLNAMFWLTRISIGSFIDDEDYYMVVALRVKS